MSVLRFRATTSNGRTLFAYSATIQGAKEKMKLALAKGERLGFLRHVAAEDKALDVVDNRKAPGS